MRPLQITALVLVVGITCGSIGYLAGESRSRMSVAETNFAALQHYVPAILYLRKGETTSAKSVHYSGTDVALATFAKDNADSLSPPGRDALAGMLARLNVARLEDNPSHRENSR